MRKYFIQNAKKKFKGNLHTHSTRSDGGTPEESLINYYRDRGYNFLALSDHRKVFNDDKYNGDNFIMIPGMEMDVWTQPNPKNKFFHFQVLGDLEHDKCYKQLTVKKYEDAKEIYDLFKDNVRIINHPRWSRMTLNDLLYYSPDIMEIYNHASEIGFGLRFDTGSWDELLLEGKKVFGVASDDTHRDVTNKDILTDSCGGYIMVESEELSTNCILKNITRGNFYSATGPVGPDFKNIYYEDGFIYVESTEVTSIRFITFYDFGYVKFAKENETINNAKIEVGKRVMIRVEIEDENGLRAWSNPIFFDHRRDW